MVLRLPAQSAGDCQAAAHAPVVRGPHAAVEDIRQCILVAVGIGKLDRRRSCRRLLCGGEIRVLRKVKGSVESSIGIVRVTEIPCAKSKLDRVRAQRKRGNVLKLHLVEVIVAGLLRRAAARKPTLLHDQIRCRAHGCLRCNRAVVLEARFVHEVIVDDLRIAQLNLVEVRRRRECQRRKLRRTKAALHRVVIVLIPRGQRILRSKLLIQPGRNIGTHMRVVDRSADAHRAVAACRTRCIKRAQIVDVAMLGRNEERRVLLDRSAQCPVVLIAVVGRNRRLDQRIRRVELARVSLKEELPVKLVRARLGQNLDAAIAQPIILG